MLAFQDSRLGGDGLVVEGVLDLGTDGALDLKIGGRRLAEILKGLQFDGEIVRVDLRIYDLDEETVAT